MVSGQLGGVIQHLRRVLRDGAGLTDGQLLEDYLSRRDEAAFAALVRRHGPMVWGVCCRVLRNHHDAEDAFQATFLVLVRRAASIASRELLANWLYGVAHQTALKARATISKRKGRERQVTEMPQPAVTHQDTWRDLQPLLDEELSRLPGKYRGVIVLCDLDGKTRKQAARHLGLAEGTVASRLARARIMLAKRLAKRGLALSGAALAAVLAQGAVSAGVPNSVVDSTIKAASLLAAGGAAATGAISLKVVALTEGVLKAMLLTKLKVAAGIVLILGFVASGATIVTCRTAAGQDDKKPAAEKPMEPTAKQEKQREENNETVTAWGKEVGGLQAGLGYRPGEHRAYHHGETVKLVVRVRNVGTEKVTLQYLSQFLIEVPPAVTDSKGKRVPAGMRNIFGVHLAKQVDLAPGKDIELYGELEVRSDFGTGKVSVQYERVFGNSSSGQIKLDPNLSKLATGKLELEIKADSPPASEKKEEDKYAEKERQKLLPLGPYRTAPIGADVAAKKEAFTAWSEEVGGLQAGLGYDPGQKRAYRHGETVRLVLRVRNVSKKEVEFVCCRQYFMEMSPTMTDGQGKPVRLPSNPSTGKPRLEKVSLAPGKEIKLYELKFKLGPPSQNGADDNDSESEDFAGRVFTFYGTGRFQIQYERLIEKPWARPEPDPILSKLATGKLELEVKADPPPASEKKEKERPVEKDTEIESEPANLEKWTQGKGVVDVCFAGAWQDPLKLRSSLKIKAPETDMDFRLACGEGGGENRSFVQVSMTVTPENVRRLLALQAELKPRGYLVDPKETKVWSYPVDSKLSQQVRTLVPQFREAVERDLKKRLPKVQWHLERNRFLKYEVPGTKVRGFVDVHEIKPGSPNTDVAIQPEEELHLPHLGLWIRLYYSGASEEDAATHEAIRKVFRQAVEPFLKLDPGAVVRNCNYKWRDSSRK